ncbi:beta-ketoacyl-ACP synthase II [Leadbettera azotonutricia]|uniref:3-oxoacyl-[acyl-carrier-protein] synthase 2 n=1 Tax=Leadbettera azotonutricia (strain ATCC BAA-888 / DSM 13862 / ZAS-9) TaxID=545695 RepID=F5Y6P8_LEAAZ|nr:beta-ketoacyl-ACP synthase II [Leadbettera azotonutricia]AEF82074.1 3-oxoacyl-[acyl-carrier-protein] synthase II [Leadbettera azotonutricia ZAS-9]
MKKKVVVTGMGVISPIGKSVEEFSAALKEGKSGIGKITQFDTTGFDVTIAGEVKDFEASKWFDNRAARKMARFTQFAAAAATEALEQAGLLGEAGEDGKKKIKCVPESAGIVIGNGIGGFEIVTESFRKLFDIGPKRMLPLTVPLMINNEAAANIAILYGLEGPAFTQVTACASGTDALGQALDLIRSGRCEVVVSGGSEACITQFSIGGFQMLKALSTKRCNDPAKASRPFDADRDGFVLGEGAGVLVLESEEHAKKRGAKILAELAGYGASCDAYHITSPEPSGIGGGRAIKMALQDAELKPEEVQYYNAHGTSTEINDPTETKMIKYAFGDHAQKMKVSSIKSMTGHCVAGSGGIEAVSCVLAIREGFYPPTINLDNPDPACDLDYVPNKAQYGEISAAASGSLGFGGHNGVVVFKKYSQEGK